MDAYTRAATNRSIRTIKTELDFLLDSELLTPQQVSSIHALLPDAPNAIRSQVASPTPSSVPKMNNLSISSPPPASTQTPSYTGTNEKSQPIPTAEPEPAAPPPTYNAATGIAMARALYAYTPTDTGDLSLLPHDRVVILEYMNADWAKGRSERTGDEGIFPRSYVKVEDEKEKGGPPPPPTREQYNAGAYNGGYGQSSAGYGNVPAETAGGSGQVAQGGESKVNGQGKKFGKKLGNAAIFGAGATIGSNIVNGIF